MIDGIPIGIGDLSGWGVVAILVIMLLTGRGLATRREVDAEKTRADTWQAAWQAERSANREKDAQGAELLEHARTTSRIVAALQAQAQTRVSPGDGEGT